MFRVYLSGVFVLLAGAAVAQEPALKPIVLTLHAPKPSLRKLQYPLLVPLSEQRAGNAVIDYKEANKKHKQLINDEGACRLQREVGSLAPSAAARVAAQRNGRVY